MKIVLWRSRAWVAEFDVLHEGCCKLQIIERHAAPESKEKQVPAQRGDRNSVSCDTLRAKLIISNRIVHVQKTMQFLWKMRNDPNLVDAPSNATACSGIRTKAAVLVPNQSSSYIINGSQGESMFLVLKQWVSCIICLGSSMSLMEP